MRPWGDGPAPFDLTNNIGSPVLGLFGEEDGNPSPDDVKKLDAELTRLGKTHEFHSFSGVGHGFMAAGRPGYKEDKANDAWAKCIGWFRTHLGA
jgi:carboxymethylenebutenolidase